MAPLHQLLPQKRLLNEDERAIYSGSKSQCLSRHTAKTSRPEPYIHCQSTIVQDNWPGIVEERWNSASDISMSASSNEADVVANDKPGSESQASPDLCSPEPVEVCYGCVCRGTIISEPGELTGTRFQMSALNFNRAYRSRQTHFLRVTMCVFSKYSLGPIIS